MHVLRQVTCKEPTEAVGLQPSKVLHALPEFVSGEKLSALKNSVLHQFDTQGAQQRCLPSSCVLPQAKVVAAVGERLRQALALAESTPTVDVNLPFAAREGTNVYLPALRTELHGQDEADFHDDYDADEPSKEATWTALLYLDAASGDRFMVRRRDNPEHVESHEIKPGTLILFKSSEVQHTAKGTAQESRRLALGPVALDQASRGAEVKESVDSFRSRILQWGSGNSGGSSYSPSSSSNSKSSSTSGSNDIKRHCFLAAVVVALLAMVSFSS
jgi:hypothetical protein